MATEDRVSPEGEITCVDCGGRCVLISHTPPEGFTPGDIVAYRCTECWDRWDLVLPDDLGDAIPAAPARRRRRRGRGEAPA